MRYFLGFAAVFGFLAACSVVNSPTEPEDPDSSGNGAATSSTNGSGGTGAEGGSGPDTCNDGMLNGDETDVDCGGSCDPCSPGSDCSAASDCNSGFCVDDVCCDSACDGICEACSEDKTGSGSGLCAAIAQGTDPDAECAAEPEASCGVAGTGCNGAGACELHPSGTVCQPSSCMMGVETSAGLCDGSGTCVPGGQMPCGDYTCDQQTGTCKTTCMNNMDCVPPLSCNPTTGVCSSTVTFSTHNFMGMTEYPLDTDTCMCCGTTTTAQTANAFCVLAGMTSAVTWTTGNITGNNCYCWDCTQANQWASNCCSGQASRPMILTVTCQ